MSGVTLCSSVSHTAVATCHTLYLTPRPREARSTGAVVAGYPVSARACIRRILTNEPHGHVSRASVETRPRPALVPVSLAVVSRVAIWPPAQYYAHQAEICKVGIVR